MQAEILNIQSVFAGLDLHIPNYQRPYRWQPAHVQSLLDDLSRAFSAPHAPAYRLGSLVLHIENHRHHVVDGQQRLTTLALLLHVLEPASRLDFWKQKFQHSESQRNIIHNHAYMRRFFENTSEDNKHNFLKNLKTRCEMVCITLRDLDEAFQFFDTQNTRGKPLHPHDLLKAYHLRVIPETNNNKLSYKCAERWEKIADLPPDAPNLETIISYVLFRLRRWIKRERSAPTFTHAHLSDFKGIHPDAPFPYVQQQVQAHKHYKNGTPPFSLDSPIIDGEIFFDYVEHYQKLHQKLFDTESGPLAHITLKNGDAMLDFIAKKGGNRFLKRLFECTMLAYVDRFGEARLDEVAHLVFRRVYTMRLRKSRIDLNAIENSAIDRNGLFAHIQKSKTPDEVLQFSASKVRKKEIKYHGPVHIDELMEQE